MELPLILVVYPLHVCLGARLTILLSLLGLSTAKLSSTGACTYANRAAC